MQKTKTKPKKVKKTCLQLRQSSTNKFLYTGKEVTFTGMPGTLNTARCPVAIARTNLK